MLTPHIRTCGQYREDLSDTSQVLRAADDRDWCSDLDPLEKHGGEISRHPHACVGRGISGKVTGVHPYRRAEFHEVRHRRGLIMAARGYMAAGSRIRVNYSSVSVDDRPEAPRPMVEILIENAEVTRRR